MPWSSALDETDSGYGNGTAPGNGTKPDDGGGGIAELLEDKETWQFIAWVSAGMACVASVRSLAQPDGGGDAAAAFTRQLRFVRRAELTSLHTLWAVAAAL